MKTTQKIFQACLILTLTLGLLAPVGLVHTTGPTRLTPDLVELATEAPEQLVRVIVQKATDSGQAEHFVEQLGGRVLKHLELINAFVAQLPAEALPTLARNNSVNWVSLDAPMVPAEVTTYTVRDEFNAISYGGNDGTASWSTDWQEINESNGPDSGDEKITSNSGSNRLRIRDNDGGGEGVMRQAYLSTATSATLSFDYRRDGLDSSSDYVALEISADGGASWTELDRFAGSSNDSSYLPWSQDISSYLSSNTTIRFLSSASLGRYDNLYIDNVQIEYTADSAGGGGGDPIPPDGGDGGDPIPPATSTMTVRDEFNAESYGNNDGTESWTNNWQEIAESDGTSSGRIRVVPYNDCAQPPCLRVGGTTGTNTGNPGLGTSRAADLSSYSSATLTFSYRRGHYDGGGSASGATLTLSVSSDDGATWQDLQTYSYDGEDETQIPQSFDISSAISTHTQIRFLSAGALNDRVFFIDNIQIEANLDPNTFLETLGVDQLHAEGITGQGVTVAVIDSGIGKHQDLAERMIVVPEFGIGDLYGHGTHVAGIIGGDGSASGGTYTGIAPGASFIPLGVSDEFGMAYESDVVEALQWVFDNKDTYNIRVINLSLNSTVEDSYHNSGIDAAVEILWLNGVVVVASSGNKGPAGGHNTAKTAPANDPFIIVVGASDEKDTGDPADDAIAPFSSRGTTVDGFERPDLIAPGYNIYSALSPDSAWDEAYPDRVRFDGQYIRLSGTSMAAPMVTGAVALLLSDEPNLTPDQVKYRLLHTGSDIANSTYLDVFAAVHGTTTESAYTGFMPHMLLAKMAMIAYWATENGSENVDWENVNWESVNWNAVNWNAVNWNAVNWNAVNWNAVNWNAVNWNAVNWNAVNWNAVNWNAVNWNAVNWDAVNWNATYLDGVFWGRGKDK